MFWEVLLMKIDLQRYLPLGARASDEIAWLGLGLGGCALCSTGFLVNFTKALDALYLHTLDEKVLRPDASMPPFSQLLGHLFWAGFALYLLFMVALVIYHYRLHRSGSKSIYLMKRIGRPWELHRRCWAFPLLGTVLGLLLLAMLLWGYHRLYLNTTPPQFL